MFTNGELPKDSQFPLSCVYWIHREDMKDPRTEGYIGISSKGHLHRFAQHKQAANRGEQLPVHKAIRKYKDSIKVTCLIEADPEFCLMVEEALRPVANMGKGIWNVGAGGGSTQLGFKHSEDSKKKMADSCRGREFTQETRDKISKANKGRKVTDESRKRMSIAQTGKKASEETRKKLSESHKGYVIPDATKKKMSEAAKGKIVPEVTKDKLSEKASMWNNSQAGHIWKHCTELYQSYSEGNYKYSELQLKLGLSRKPLFTMKLRFNNGWIPSEDESFMKWLSEQKEQHES